MIGYISPIICFISSMATLCIIFDVQMVKEPLEDRDKLRGVLLIILGVVTICALLIGGALYRWYMLSLL